MMPAFMEQVERAILEAESEAIPVWERAQLDHIRDTIATLPDPTEFAFRLPMEVAEALLRIHGFKAASDSDAAILRTYGLCEARGPYLGAFGLQVRAAVHAQWKGLS